MIFDCAAVIYRVPCRQNKERSRHLSQNVVSGQPRFVSSEALLRSALWDPLSINILLVASLTLMLTVSDAFETGALSLMHSALLWSLVSFLMVFQTCLCHRLFLSFYSSTQLSRLFAAGLTLFSTVLLMTVELHWMKFTPLLPKEPDPLIEFLFFVAQPVLAAGCLTLLAQTSAIQKYIDFLDLQTRHIVPANSDREELQAIVQQHRILRVSAQDHYLEIVCDEQNFLVRGRMRDALATLEPNDGIQVHRSHWVARQFMDRVLKNGRDTRLRLSDGSEVPVSRARKQTLQRFF